VGMYISWDTSNWIKLLPSKLIKSLDPNFPPMTKVTRFIIFLCVSIYFISSLPFMPSITICTYFCLNACILGKSHDRIACFKYIHLSKPTWFKMSI
jgi:hypothetical protein